MRTLWLLLFAVLCILQPPQAAAQADAPSFEQEDVFQLEWASDPQIAPDGDRVVYVRNGMSVMEDRRTRQLWVVGTDGAGHRKLTAGEASESSPRWSPDGTRVAYVASTDEGAELFVRWMDTGQTARLTQLERSPSGLAWSPDGEHLAFTMTVPAEPEGLDAAMPSPPEGAEWAEQPRVTTRLRHEADGSGYIEPGYEHLFVVPAEGGTARQLTRGDFHHDGTPAWMPDGREIIVAGNRNADWERDFIESELYAVSVEDGTIRRLTERDGPDHSPAVSPDGQHVAYLGYDDRVQTYQTTELYVMNRDGTDRRLLTDGLDRSVSVPVWTPDGNGIFVEYEDEGDTKIARVTLGGEVKTLTGGLGGTTIGRPYGGGSFSVADGGTFAYTYTDPSRPADVAVWRAGMDAPLRVTTLNADVLAHRDLGDVEEVWWTSSLDDRRIQGWIVYPPNFDPDQTYPLLLEIHGGPISNYGARFSAEMQLYAAAGYVVLYANPRGSTGYGETFGNLLHHDYPGGDYDDLMSGVEMVAGRDYIDDDRLYVTGGSAGGIMTAWIVGKTDRFRAAVVTKPVINWYSKVLVADNYYYYHDYRYPGSPWENPEAYLQDSPISLVGNVETPTMVMVGTDDLRTPPSEAKQFYHALQLRDVPTALIEIPGASHHIAARPSQLLAKVVYTLAWFDRYDAGGE